MNPILLRYLPGIPPEQYLLLKDHLGVFLVDIKQGTISKICDMPYILSTNKSENKNQFVIKEDVWIFIRKGIYERCSFVGLRLK